MQNKMTLTSVKLQNYFHFKFRRLSFHIETARKSDLAHSINLKNFCKDVSA